MKQKNCPDCGAEIGEEHHHFCDVARCMDTGGQRLSCDCGACGEEGEGGDVWTGEWPGTKECIEYGFLCFWNKDHWESCDASHPEATADLNQLYERCVWDKVAKHFVLRA